MMDSAITRGRASFLVFIFAVAFCFLFVQAGYAGVSIKNRTGTVVIVNPETGEATLYGPGDPLPDNIPDGASIQVITGTAQISVDAGSDVVIQVDSSTSSVSSSTPTGDTTSNTTAAGTDSTDSLGVEQKASSSSGYA